MKHYMCLRKEWQMQILSVCHHIILVCFIANKKGLLVDSPHVHFCISKLPCCLCPRKKVKALGVWLSTDPDMTVSLNYNDKLKKIKTILGCWKFRRLGLLGKIAVLKSLVASQLTHIFSPLQTNYKVIKEINGMFYNFLWDKRKRNVMKNDYAEGRLKIADIGSFN